MSRIGMHLPSRVAPRRPLAALRGRSGAFTLVELIVSIAMFSIIAVALQSAVMIAGKAIPDTKGPGVNLVSAGRALEQLNAELSFALSVSQMTATSVTFTVADRDGNGADETIRYSWSGIKGEPLMRTINGGTPASVLDDVREFVLSFDKRTQLNAATYTEGAETQLFTFSGGLLSVDNNIDKNAWVGEYFVPTLPGNASSWRVTRVRLNAKEHGSDPGISFVQVRTANAAGVPTGVVLDQAQLLESGLGSSYSSRDFYFTRTTARLDPAVGACIVVRWVKDADACDIQSKTLTLALLGGPKFLTTGNAGASWSGNLLAAIPMTVWGRVSVKDPDTYSYFLTGVRVQLLAGSNTNARASSAVSVLAQPQVAGP